MKEEKKTALVIGSNSDIARGLIPLLKEDNYTVRRWSRAHHNYMKNMKRWDLCILALGRVAPVGLWWQQDATDWEDTIRSNLTLPLRILRHYWPLHNPGCSVCFLAGSNPNMIMSGYSAYNTSKMGLLKLVEQMDHETPDAKIFALGPGTILTKIHKPTLAAKWDNPKLSYAIKTQNGVDKLKQLTDLKECLKWCISQPKEVIGGRNICVSDKWREGKKEHGGAGWYLQQQLNADDTLYKLRRME